jgi:hypothetical protein
MILIRPWAGYWLLRAGYGKGAAGLMKLLRPKRNGKCVKRNEAEA